MIKSPWEGKLARNMYAGSILEIFIVTAVTTVLTIRFILGATGYPQVSGGGLHVAHVLVGGLAMLISILILLTFLGNYSKSLAAVLGGFGFGAFIDELGKFITSDNNYFFQPTIGLIYITFVLLFILIKKISRSYLTEKERQINLLEISKEAVLKGDEAYGILMARSMLKRSAAQKTRLKGSNETAGCLDEIPDLPPLLNPEPKVYAAAKTRAKSLYSWMIGRRWFIQFLIAFFLLNALISLIEVIYLTIGIQNAVFWAIFALASLGVYRAIVSGISTVKKIVYILTLMIMALIFPFTIMGLTLPSLPLADWLRLGFTALAGSFSVAGILTIRKDKVRAYHLFENSMLIYIFFVHVFDFFDIQLYELFDLFEDLVTLMGLRYMINQEERKESVMGNQTGKISPGAREVM
ncbi:MAG: hypothetical protein ACP5OM_00880 [Methanothrix sp.]